MPDKRVEIYKGVRGEIVFGVEPEAETIWATKVLRRYVVEGAAVNERKARELPSEKLSKLEDALGVALVRRLLD